MNLFARTPALLALLSAALFGLATPLAKMLLGGVQTWLLAGLLYLGAGIGLGVLTLLRRTGGQPPREAPLARADMPWLAAAILTGGIAAPVMLMFGLSLTGASSGSLLLNLEAIATVAIAALVFREHIGPRLLLGAALIIAGAMTLSWQGGIFSLDSGTLLIFAACLAWGLDNNLTRHISGADPLQITMYRGLIAGSVNVGIGLMSGAAIPGPALLAGALVTGFLGYGVSLVLFVMSLQRLGTVRTGAYFSTAPFIGAIAAIAIFSDPVTMQILAAGALMGLGVWLSLTERHSHVHTHEPLEHRHRHRHDAHHQHSHDDATAEGEPHTHVHRHAPETHAHAHWPDLHHRHGH
ncbi:MAG: DMT family transporter [Alphaproteobacteria bacterium]|nr:DMT family transporter [Alphaproteobacteria bacterium]